MSEKHNPYNVEIVNVVAVASLDQNIDLIAIMKIFRNVEYRPKRFPGLVFRLKNPKTATLLFRSGKMVCTGAKSKKMAKSAVSKVVKELRKEGFIIRRMPKIEIVNIVGTADIGGGVDLEIMADTLDNVMYEPEMFPGLIYRMKKPKVVILIFRSGNRSRTAIMRGAPITVANTVNTILSMIEIGRIVIKNRGLGLNSFMKIRLPNI